jgi:hypothetical protein
LRPLIDLRWVVGWLLRTLAFAGGVAALYAGTLLYEDEYGRAQNKLEEWWVKFDDRQKIALSKAELFIRAIPALTTEILDRAFGGKLLSSQSIVASFWYSFASIFLLDSLVKSGIAATGVAIFGALTFVLFGSIGSGFFLTRYMPLLLLPVLLVLLAVKVSSHKPLDEAEALDLALLAGVICDIAFVIIVRLLLRLCERFNMAAACLVVLGGSATLGILFFALPIWLTLDSRYRFQLAVPTYEGTPAVLLIAYSNGLAFLISIFLVVSAGLLLAHRILWPTVTRLLYVVAPSKMQKVLLVTAGVLLLGIALGKPLSDEYKEIFKAMSGA